MQKIDFKKELPSYQAKHNNFTLMELPVMQYLMIDGHGDPNTSEDFAEAVATLYSLAYKLKFMSKKELQKDYTVTPLEGLWWADDMNTFTTTLDKSVWDWTLMIMVPDWISPKMFKSAIEQVKSKPGTDTSKARLERLQEGLCVQTLHIGSYNDEGPILKELHDHFIPGNNLLMNGKHHEIYLSDFRKVPPDKLKTILRQPVKKANN